MVRTITKEAFDEAVLENMEVLDMNHDEATTSAIEQFTAQGVDLSNIMTELAIEAISEKEKQELLAVIERLKGMIDNNVVPHELAFELKKLKEECDKDFPQKLIAAQNGMYDVLITILEVAEASRIMSKPAIDAVSSLMLGQPDLLNDRGVAVILRYLDIEEDLNSRQQLLQWIKYCCIKHEANRQLLVEKGLIEKLRKYLVGPGPSAPLVRDVCAVFRALVLDDDIRVEFGKCHEHAKLIATEVLAVLDGLFKMFQGDRETVHDLLSTLSSIIVRHEFCKDVEAVGGLTFIIDTMITYSEHEKVNRQVFRLLKVLSGNDDVKAKIIQSGAAVLIVAAMNRHRTSAPLITAGNGCIAALCLRNADNARALHDAGAAEAIILGMRTHSNEVDVQKQGSWAIRNIVSRDRCLAKSFLDLGAEEMLNEILVKFGENCNYDAKAALRDLGCEVELTERWTGKGGALN